MNKSLFYHLIFEEKEEILWTVNIALNINQ